MKKLLWVGDAGCDTGFARCTHKTLESVCQVWDVSVLGLNYRGDPHKYPYPIYPAERDGDYFGIRRLREILAAVRPDLIVLQNDPWNIPQYMKYLENYPVVAALAVDGKNCRGRNLNGVRLSIFWTKFAEEEAKLGGYAGLSEVIPLGVDLEIYKPRPRAEARAALGLPRDIRDRFIVGNLNRNHPRKRLDLMIAYFAEWVLTRNVPDALLFLYANPTGSNDGVDCDQLAAYYGVGNRLILIEPPVFFGLAESQLADVYASFDVMATTTQGEGWGLPTMEGMACGIPQIVPNWSALGEWCGDAAMQVPCTATATTFNGINAIGGVADRAMFIEALDTLYRDPTLRERLRHRGLSTVQQPQYRWTRIGERFLEAFERALAQPIALTEKDLCPAS